jgi:hypothetical protein
MASDAPPGDGVCGLLKLDEVKRVLPDVQSAERDRSLDQSGITSCAWKGARGARSLTVQHWEGEDSAETELNSLVEGIADPLKSGAAASIRRQKLNGIGDEAVAVVERPDEKRGVLTYAALLVVKRGKHVLTVASSDLATRDRAEALKALESLGRAAITRVK